MADFDKKLSSAALESKKIETKNSLQKDLPKATKDDTTGNLIVNHGHLSINRGLKPCFRPNGQLLTFHTMTQNMGPHLPPQVRTRAVIHKMDERKQVDLTDTLIKNIKIQEVVHEPLRFGDELKFHTMIRSDAQESQVSLYESAYFQNLISKSKIPLVNYDSSPKGIFHLLKDAAEQYVAQT